MNPIALIVGYACVLIAGIPSMAFAMSNAGILARPFYRRYAFYLLGLCGFMTLAPLIQFLGQHHGPMGQWVLLGLHMAIMATMGLAVKNYHPGLLPGGETRRKWGTWFVLGTLTNATLVSIVFLRIALGLAQRKPGDLPLVGWDHYGPLLVLLGWIILYADCKRQKVLLPAPIWTSLTLTGYVCSICGIVLSVYPYLPTSFSLITGKHQGAIPLHSLIVGLLGLTLGLIQFAWLAKVWTSLGSLVMTLVCFCGIYHLFLAQWGYPWLGLSGAPLLYLPLIAFLDRLTIFAVALDNKRQRYEAGSPATTHDSQDSTIDSSRLPWSSQSLKLSRPLGILIQSISLILFFLAAWGPVSFFCQFESNSGTLWSLDDGFLASLTVYSLYLMVTWFVYAQPFRGYLGFTLVFLILLLGKPFLGSSNATAILSGLCLLLVLVGRRGSRWHESHQTLQVATDMGLLGFLAGMVLVGYRQIIAFEAETRGGFLSEQLFLCSPSDAFSLVAIGLTATICGFRYRSILVSFSIPLSLALLFMPQLGILGLVILLVNWAFDKKMLSLSEKLLYPTQKFLGHYSLPLPTMVPASALYWALTVSLLPLTFLGFLLDSTLLLQSHGSPLTMLSLLSCGGILIYSSIALFQPGIYLLGLIAVNLAILVITRSILEKAGGSLWIHPDIPLGVFALTQLFVYSLFGRLLAFRFPGQVALDPQPKDLDAQKGWMFHQIHLGFNQLTAFLVMCGVLSLSFQNHSFEITVRISLCALVVGWLHSLLSFKSYGNIFVHTALMSFALSFGLLLKANHFPLWQIGNILSVAFLTLMVATMAKTLGLINRPSGLNEQRWTHASGHLALALSLLNVLQTGLLQNGFGQPGFPSQPLLISLGTFGMVCLVSTLLLRTRFLMMTGLTNCLLVLHGLFHHFLEASFPDFWVHENFLNPIEPLARMAHGGVSLAWITSFLVAGWFILFQKVRKSPEQSMTFPIRMNQLSWFDFLGLSLLQMGFIATLLGLAGQTLELFANSQSVSQEWFGPGHAILCLGYGFILLFFAAMGQIRFLSHLGGGAVILGLIFIARNPGAYPLNLSGAIHGAGFIGLILGLWIRFFQNSVTIQFLCGKVPVLVPIPGGNAIAEANLEKEHSSLLFPWATGFLLGSLGFSLFWSISLGISGVLPVLYMTCGGLLLVFGRSEGPYRFLLGLGGTIIGYAAVVLHSWWMLPTIFDWKTEGIPDTQMVLFLVSILTGIIFGITFLWNRFYPIDSGNTSQPENRLIPYGRILIGFNLFVTLLSTCVFLGITFWVNSQQLLENYLRESNSLVPFQNFFSPGFPNRFLGWTGMVLFLVMLTQAAFFSSGLALCIGWAGLGLALQIVINIPSLTFSFLGCYGLVLCLLIPSKGWISDRIDLLFRQKFLPWPGIWEKVRFPLETGSESWQWRTTLTGLALALLSVIQVLFNFSVQGPETLFPEYLSQISLSQWVELAVSLQCLSWALLVQYRWIPSWTWFLGTTVTLTLASYPLVAIINLLAGSPVTIAAFLGTGPVLDAFAFVMLGLSLILVQRHSLEVNTDESTEGMVPNLLWIFATLVATLGWIHALAQLVVLGQSSPASGWVILICLVIPLAMLTRVVGSLGKAIPMEVRQGYLCLAILAPWISGLVILGTYLGPDSISPWTLGYALACGLGVCLLGKSGPFPGGGGTTIFDQAPESPLGFNWVLLARIVSFPMIGMACLLPGVALAWQLRILSNQTDISLLLRICLLPLATEAINLAIIAWLNRQKRTLVTALWVANLGIVSLLGGYLVMDYQYSLMVFVVILHVGLFTLGKKAEERTNTMDSSLATHTSGTDFLSFWRAGIQFWVESTALVCLFLEFMTTAIHRINPELGNSDPLFQFLAAGGLMMVFGRLWKMESSALWFNGFSLSLVHLVLVGLINLGVVPSIPLISALYALIWISLVGWKNPEDVWIPLFPGNGESGLEIPNQNHPGGMKNEARKKNRWTQVLVIISLGLVLLFAPLELAQQGNTSMEIGILALAWLIRRTLGRINLGILPKSEQSEITISPGQALGPDPALAPGKVPVYEPDWGWVLGLGTGASLFLEFPLLRTWLTDLALPIVVILMALYQTLARIRPVPSWDQPIQERLGWASLITAGLSLLSHMQTFFGKEEPVWALIWIIIATGWLFYSSMKYRVEWGIYLGFLGCGMIWLVTIHQIMGVPIREKSWDAAALIASCFLLFGISIGCAPLGHTWSQMLGKPAFRLSVGLPLGLLLLIPGEIQGMILVFLSAGSFYLFVSIQSGNRWFLYISAALINTGIYLGMPGIHQVTGLSQLYVIPAAVTLLIVSQIHRREFPQRAITSIRYAAASAILASSTGEYYLSHQSTLAHFVLVLTASLTAIASGIALKIRPFLFLGLGFLVVNVLGQLGTALLVQTGGVIRAGILIALGMAILGMMVFFNSRRSQLLTNYRSFMDHPDWE